jgi:hypothetical protein
MARYLDAKFKRYVEEFSVANFIGVSLGRPPLWGTWRENRPDLRATPILRARTRALPQRRLEEARGRGRMGRGRGAL